MIPVTVGFGIKTPDAARKISMFSDGIIIGSSIVELIHKHSNNKNVMKKNLASYLSSISRAI